MIWYKGLRIIVDGLAQLKAQGKQFRMVFVGGGEEAQEVQNYVSYAAEYPVGSDHFLNIVSKFLQAKGEGGYCLDAFDSANRF